MQTIFTNMGWQCPVCRRCFSPATSMCMFCPGLTGVDLPAITITSTPAPTTQPIYNPDVQWYPINAPATTGVYPLTVGESGVVPLTVGEPQKFNAPSGQWIRGGTGLDGKGVVGTGG